LKYGRNDHPIQTYCGSDHAEPRNAADGAAAMAASAISGLVSNARTRWHWLRYDSVALAVLAIGLGIVILFALTI
jgi:hypothetical protein